MKAIQIKNYGNNEVLEAVELGVPEVLPNQILVKLKASSVNPIDYKIRSGYLSPQLKKNFPFTLGWEGAGIIVEKGIEVNSYNIGDEVMVMPNFMQGGTYAEFVAVNQEEVLPKPQNISFNKAATIPFSLGTAYTALIEDAQIKEGQRILILGAGGAVGKMAVQIAKMNNLNVVGTASGEDLDILLELGIDHVIDYTKTPLSEIERRFDVVLDLVGGEFLLNSYPLLVKGGTIISTTQVPDENEMKKNSISGKMTFTDNRDNKLKKIINLLDSGKIIVQEPQVFKLENAKKALSLVENREAQSKIVFEF